MDFVGELTRRRLLQAASYGVAVSSIALLTTPAAAIGATQTPIEVKEAAESEASARPSISIRVPSTIEDYEAVPVTVSVENGAFERSSVESVHLLVQGAPSGEAARFHPVANGPVVEVSGNLAMGQSRRIWAVARLTDGSVCMATADLPA